MQLSEIKTMSITLLRNRLFLKVTLSVYSKTQGDLLPSNGVLQYFKITKL